MTKFTTKLIKTDVTALKIHKHILLAGVGSQLQVYNLDTNEVIHKKIVFDGLRIHGIQINSSGSHLLLTAENEYLILRTCLDNEDKDKWFIPFRRIEMHDWILAAKWLQYNNYAVVTMHNVVEFLNDDTLMLDHKTCSTKCILYSAEICYNTIRECVILSGTVFSEILVWRPYFSCDVYHRLTGHEGVLFSIQQLGPYILSSSDDRSVILWKIDGNLQETTSTIALQHKMHGHTARVFRCKILADNVLSAGEDGRVCLWDLHGNLLRTFNVHHGGSVWSIDGDETGNLIISGGSDSSIARFPIRADYQSTKMKITEGEVPKKLALLFNGDIVVITESGKLLHYVREENVVQSIAQCGAFKSYSLLEVSSCRQKFALAGYCGDIHIYRLSSDGSLVAECFHKIPNKQRIFSIHWLTCNHLLSCGPDGVLYLWKLHNDFKDDCALLLIGIYEIPASKERWSTAACRIPTLGITIGDRKGNLHYFHTDESTPCQTIRRAHSHLGITHLHWNQNQRILISLGRNSTLRTFQLNDKGTEFISLTADVLPFAWLGRKVANENVILGFSGDEMILWDCDKRIELFSTNCGGGHRSWDADSTWFIYIRDKAVHTVRTRRPIELASSTHATEMNTMTCVKTNDTFMMVSGGEDTTLRFSTFTSDKELINVATIKSHLSSIRCLLIVKSADAGKELYELFTAGGRGQIIYWQLSLDANGDYLHCKEVHSYYEPQNEEVRIMDLVSTMHECKRLLFAACSDGTVKIYSVTDNKLALHKTINYKLRCVLKLCILPLVNNCNKNYDSLLVTMATDGFLCFWHLHHDEESPIFSYQVHKSGINAYDFKCVGTNIFVYLTGGDDNQISVIVFEYTDINVINVLYHYKNVDSHCAQITGAYLGDKYFFTSSLDQKLLMFEYDIDTELKVTYKASHSSTISDIKGINVFHGSNHDEFDIILYGLGIELLKFKIYKFV